MLASIKSRRLITIPEVKFGNLPVSVALTLACVSGFLLALPFLNPDYYLAAWIAFVPLLIALKNTGLARAYGLGTCCGLVLYCCNTYWIADYIHLFKGVSYREGALWGGLFWLYCSQLVALLAVATVYLNRQGISELLFFPVVVILVFALFPMLFSVQLGEGQSHFYYAIQAVDIVGVHGLDGILALSNILVYRFVIGGKLSLTAKIVSSVILVGWFSYGIWAMDYWQDRMQGWSSVNLGFVQPNEKPTLGRYPVHQGYSKHYPPELELTELLAKQGADWVVWPEARYKSALDNEEIMDSYRQTIADSQVNLLFQDMTHSEAAVQGIKRNKVVAVNRQGLLIAEHQKSKLVPFGEYTPLLHSAPWVANVFTAFFGEFTREVEAGKGHQSFTLDALNVVPLICNETMYSRFVAQAVGDQPKHLLIGMSSNGWFGNTLQPYQHANASALRAVENRLTFLHVLNNGPSLAVLPTGEFLFQAEYGVAGAYLFAAPYPAEGNTTLYSRYPNAFMYLVYFASGLLALWCVWLNLLKRDD